MQTTTPAISMNIRLSMVKVVNYFRIWWVNRENARLEKQFEKANGRLPTGEERIEMMQSRIDYFRRVGLR